MPVLHRTRYGDHERLRGACFRQHVLVSRVPVPLRDDEVAGRALGLDQLHIFQKILQGIGDSHRAFANGFG
jgi:hypothetical protein